MKLPPGKEVTLKVHQKIRGFAFDVGSFVSSRDWPDLPPGDLVRISSLVERVVARELSLLYATEIRDTAVPSGKPSKGK